MSPPEDRVAVVTGAARGIGAATVAVLAARGWRVVAVDCCADNPELPYPMGSRSDLDGVVAAAQALAVARAATVARARTAAPPGTGEAAGTAAPPGTGAAAGNAPVPGVEALAATAAAAGAAGAGQLGGVVQAGETVPGAAAIWVIGAQADVRDPDALAAAVGLAEDYWGGLDVAIAAAGVIAGGVPAWHVPAGQEQAILDIDLGGVLNLARVAVPALLRRLEPRHGRFLAVASAAATRGLPMLAAYCAAKAGVTGFIRALAVELGGTGITANAVSPGSTATPILDESARLYDLPGADAFAAQQPLGRLIDPAEVAAVLAFLADDGASAMTGAIVPVDGGLAL
jgi:SDR family mycofactocin-dependent oxidoreductase